MCNTKITKKMTKITFATGLETLLSRIAPISIFALRFILIAHSNIHKHTPSHIKLNAIASQLSCPTSDARMEGKDKNFPPIRSSKYINES